MAMLIFFPGTAGAGVVAAYFGLAADYGGAAGTAGSGKGRRLRCG